ncbi:MAG: hypothetical protein Q9172_006935 [Xanthocarpia lactea]
MEPVSVSASVLTIAEVAAHVVIYIRKVRTASKDLSNFKNELQSLRNELEEIADLLERAESDCDAESTSRLSILQRLADPGNSSSPLARCHEELTIVVKELERSGWGPQGSRRSATVKALIWPFKKQEITKTLESIKSLKATMISGLRNDEVALALETSAGVRNLNEQALSIRENLEHDQIFKWFSAPDPAPNHYEASKKRAAATGKWFIDSTKYVKWKVEPHSVCWLHGILGCGKTILSSTIIEDLWDHCKQNTQCALAYFYFDFKSSEKQDCAKMLRSLLKQLSNQNPECLKLLEALYLANDKGRKQPSLDALSTLLQDMVGVCDTTFIVLDALDECNADECISRSELLRLIESIDLWHQDGLHMLLTSRTEPEIRMTMESLNHGPYKINIQKSLITEDIRTHVRSRLSHDPNLKRWQKVPNALQEIEERLIEKADGMFLLANCQLDALQSCLTMDMLMKTLGSLPATLNETYAHILGNIHKDHTKLAIKAFQWMIHARETLSIDQMVDILAIDVAAEPRFSPKRRPIEQEDVIKICCNLIDISSWLEPYELVSGLEPLKVPVRNGVRLAHLSVKEYLTSDQISATPVADFAPQDMDAHASIAQDCLSCLLHVKDCRDAKGRKLVDASVEQRKQLAELHWGQRRELRMEFQSDLMADLPMISYATEWWTYHARKAGEKNERLFQLMVEAFDPDTFEAWYRYIDQDWGSFKEYRGVNERAPASLTYAIEEELPRLAQHLLEHGVDANLHRSGWLTPLGAAVKSVDIKLVKLLLKFGADANLSGGPSLHYATHKGSIEMVELLLQYGADIDRKTYGETPLAAAAKENRIPIAELLIAKGANIDADGLGTPLLFASSEGHSAMVRLLLSKGVSTCLDGNKAALPKAAAHGHEETVRLLLVAGFDVNAFTSISDPRHPKLQTALYAAATNGRVSILRLLIDWGADVNVNLHPDGVYDTALQAASKEGHLAAVELLLRSGAELDIQGDVRGDGYFSAFQTACAHNHESIIRLFLQHGSDVNEGGGYGSPLRAAVSHFSYTAIQILLDAGADVNQGGQRGTALETALQLGNGFAAHQLLAAGAHKNVGQELQLRLEDAQRGIDDLEWRDRQKRILNEAGEYEDVRLGSLPDEISYLEDKDFWDRSLSFS